MARYDDSKPYRCEYDEDCAICGEEFSRSELAWIDDELTCAVCEDLRADAAPGSPEDVLRR